MPLPSFPTENDVPEAFRSEYEQREGQWRPKIEKELETEKNKRSTVLTEKGALVTAKADLESQLATARNELAVAQSGMEPQKLEAYAAPFKTEAATEKAGRIAAETKLADAEKLKLLRQAARDAGMMMERVDDEDNTDMLSKKVTIKDGALVSVDKAGNVLPTPVVEMFKALKSTKAYLFPWNGGSGGGAEPANGGPIDGPRTAATDLKRINDQRAAQVNPLAPKVAKV